MDFEEFDVVEYEESEALSRYIMEWKLGTLTRVAEALCALFLFGFYFSDVSIVTDVGRGLLLRQLKALTTPLSAFLFGNCIVLIVFVLSSGGGVCGEMDDGEDEGNAVFRHSCEEHESLEKSSPGKSCSLRMEMKDSPEVMGLEELIDFSLSTEEVKEVMAVTAVHVDVNEIPAVFKEMGIESNSKPQEDEIGSPTIYDGESNMDSPIVPAEGLSSNRDVLRRSNSEVISSAKRPSKTELDRWESENARTTNIPDTGGDDRQSPSPFPPSSVDDLSDEEFNQKVERYIAGKKLLLWVEMLAEQSVEGPQEIDSACD
ncbi:hypothetical protein MLD38_000771 [Melastoma candidum]|uniref:Uncharacterized protein n=1 Tax=Melastoma candidum TaxID=119954 RepID=A0ACB9SBJ8_9MYRT|nr:hypothetical protein MLD38_000771 [Melastoma candidum]